MPLSQSIWNLSSSTVGSSRSRRSSAALSHVWGSAEDEKRAYKAVAFCLASRTGCPSKPPKSLKFKSLYPHAFDFSETEMWQIMETKEHIRLIGAAIQARRQAEGDLRACGADEWDEQERNMKRCLDILVRVSVVLQMSIPERHREAPILPIDSLQMLRQLDEIEFGSTGERYADPPKITRRSTNPFSSKVSLGDKMKQVVSWFKPPGKSSSSSSSKANENAEFDPETAFMYTFYDILKLDIDYITEQMQDVQHPCGNAARWRAAEQAYDQYLKCVLKLIPVFCMQWWFNPKKEEIELSDVLGTVEDGDNARFTVEPGSGSPAAGVGEGW